MNRSKKIKIYINKSKYITGLIIIALYALLPLKVVAVDYGFFAANDILFYDPSDCNSDGSTTGTGSAANGSIVVIGDSLMDNDKGPGQIAKKLKDKGYSDVTVDSSSSRSLTRPGADGKSGMQAIETNRDKILNAGTIVIELGTNSDNGEIKKIPDMMKTIYDINGNIKSFWVNTVNNSDKPRATGVNKGISKYASAQKYTIIDWYKAVYGSGTSADTSLLDDSGYHQSNPKGIEMHTKLIVDSVGAPSSGGGSGGGAPVTGSTQDKNAAKVWNYLTGKGLSTKAAAGFLGNMETESGISPTSVESGGTGHGLVQWSHGRWTDGYPGGLTGWANKYNKPWQDIDLQFDYLWYELNHAYKTTVLEPLKSVNSVDAAAVIILLHFEIPSPEYQVGEYRQKRIDDANKWYRKFSSYGSGSGVVSGTNCTCSTDGSSDSGKTKILIGPGHTGNMTAISKYKGDPPIKDKIYGNKPELQDVWDVAQIVKTKLEAKGYNVLMTKNSVNDKPFSWDRAQQANNNNVDLALEIHTSSPSGNFGSWGQVWSQLKDGYAVDKNGQKVYSVASDSVIAKSKEYAKKMAQARKDAGEPGVVAKTSSGFYSNTDPTRNTTLVQLWSKVPWIYLEAGADKSKDSQDSGGITDKQKQTYAEGIVNGVVDSVPPTGVSSGSSGDDCVPSSSGDAGAIVDWALKFAWDDTGHTYNDAKQVYKDYHEKLWPGVDYTACNQFVEAVIRASGADPKMVKTQVSIPYPGSELEYLRKHTKLYEKVSNPHSTKNLQPGDIMILVDSHTFLYVGNQKGGNIREASWSSGVVGAGHSPEAGSFSWYQSRSNLEAYRLK